MTQGMEWSLIVWGVVTGILLILLFYRSTLTRQEDDQLFIDKSSGETGRRNVRPDALGHRGLGCLPWIELGSAVGGKLPRKWNDCPLGKRKAAAWQQRP